MKSLLCTLLVLAVLVAGTAFGPEPSSASLSDTDSLAELLERLGDTPLPHRPDLSLPGVSAERGREIVLRGITRKPKGGRIGKQSKHFECTACHNVEREDPDLARVDPRGRLAYVVERGLPYLPGTTLYGVVNRTSFYNGDYEKKYGDLVKPARHDLREAIQLCAVECSQGRRLKDWELESVLAYLWTLELRLSDLRLSPEEKATVQRALDGQGDRAAAVALLKARYLQGAPATFGTPPEDRRLGYVDEGGVRSGDPDTGRLLYEHSCLHCHENQRYAFFNLDDSALSFRFLEKHLGDYSRYNLYQVVRYGTQPLPGKRAYMPNYTLEKLPDDMVEDLRAYIELRAGKWTASQ